MDADDKSKRAHDVILQKTATVTRTSTLGVTLDTKTDWQKGAAVRFGYLQPPDHFRQTPALNLEPCTFRPSAITVIAKSAEIVETPQALGYIGCRILG